MRKEEHTQFWGKLKHQVHAEENINFSEVYEEKKMF